MFCPVTRFFEKMAEEDKLADKYERLIEIDSKTKSPNSVVYTKRFQGRIPYVRIDWKEYTIIVGDPNSDFENFNNPIDGKAWIHFVEYFKSGECVSDSEIAKEESLPIELKAGHPLGLPSNYKETYSVVSKRVK